MKINIEIDGTPGEIENLNLAFTKAGTVIQTVGEKPQSNKGLFSREPVQDNKVEQPTNDYDPDGVMDSTQVASVKPASELEIPEVKGGDIDSSFAEGEW